ncbi:MAG: hypothetical protein ACOWWO_13585 [Peptococcaceae bacterium]
MPRYRKITPVNINEQERILSEKFNQNRPKYKKTVRRTQRPNENPLLPLYQLKTKLQRSFENRSTQEVVFDTCKSLRGICGQVRSFADEVDNLLGSVESIVPVMETVVSSYARSLKNKEQPILEKDKIPAEETNKAKEDQSTDNENPIRENTADKTSKMPAKMPSEMEIKEFLNNPLVASLLQNLTQKMMTNKQQQ